jgi:polyhydroxybutyrate depolymerase
MRAILIVFLLTSVSLAQVEYGSFELDGYEREYIVFLPENFEPGLPLVFNLHGYGLTPEQQIDISFMNDVADTAGFVVVYPNAVDDVWNSGVGDSPNWPVPDVDDVAFLSALIDTLLVDYEIDTNRVYSCGFSNGGFMSFRLALELGERIQKIASVVGVVTQTVAEAAPAAGPVPVLCMLGTADPLVPFEGGEPGWYSGPETVDFWIEHNQCSSAVDTLSLPDFDPFDDCTATLFPYSGGVEGTQVIYYRIEGGGHKWPSGFWYSSYGAMNFDIHGSQVIWNFFNSDSYEIHGVWAHDLWLNTVFSEPGTGTLSIGAALTNTDDHNYTAFALVFDADSSIVDSVQLFDDGEHDDGIANDGIAGAFLTAPTNESFFYVQATATDIEASKYLGLHDFAQFTTAGPISFTGVDLPPSDPVPNPGDYLSIYIHLMNAGNVLELSNITASLSTQDTFVVSLSDYNRSFGNIAPGDTARSNFTYSIRIAEDCPDYHDIPIQVKIFTDGYPYWTDEFIFQVQPVVGISAEAVIIPSEYNLEQNFPNPFNPTTSISYDLPETSDLRLTIYDITGRTVATLADVHQPAGSYTTQWNGSDDSGNPVSTGVYFCRLQARDYSKTIKMVYLK